MHYLLVLYEQEQGKILLFESCNLVIACANQKRSSQIIKDLDLPYILPIVRKRQGKFPLFDSRITQSKHLFVIQLMEIFTIISMQTRTSEN